MAINFEIGLRLTDKELKSQLAGINKDLTRAFTVKNADGGFSKEIAAAATQAKALDKALRAATTNKGISYAQLNMELAKAGTTAGKLTSTLAQGGTYFRQSLDQANNALALSNRHVLSLNKVLQEAARVFKQSFKFTVAQTAIRAISTEIRESVQWVTNLNDAVNNIAVVTGKTATQITAVTDQAIKGSKDLRIAAEDYAKGALIFYQQGLNDEEVIRRNEITIKAAKAANQSIDEMSKQLTAVWNTYGMVGDEQLRAASVGAKMAAQTAVDFSDIAQAMQTAAAPAAQMGVEYNQLAAIIATVGDTTQQSASIIGNAYKTIFSRFQQLVSDGTDGEVTLGSVSKKLSDLGVQIMNSDGTLKNLGQTINEVGNNWENWSQEQQLAIAQLVGGTRQYGQFLALMENFDKYQKNLQSAAGETGSTLERQYTQALDSIESRAENAGEAWHRAFSNVITADEIKSAYGALEQVGTAVDNIIKGMGGLPGILSIVSVLLSSKIVPALQVAGKTALTLGASLIGKQGAMINRDFNRNAADIDGNAGLKNSEKEVALAKNEFSRQTAVINEQINSQLARATGLRRTELEMQREQLAATQQNFSATMSEAQALEQKLQNQLKIYQIEGDNVGNLEVQAQKERETVQLLEEQLRILQKQSKQKTIIKNNARLGDDYKYQGTANERRTQNRAFIAQAQSKLDTARTNYGKTMDALDAAKIVEGNQKEEQSINKLVVAYGKLQSALSNYQKQKLAGKNDEAARSMEQAKLAAADLAQGLQIVRDNGAMTDKEMTEFRNTLGTLDDNVDLTKVSDQLSSIGQAMNGMKTQGENAQQVLSSTQTRAVQTAQQLGEATGVIAQQQQEQAKAAALAAQYQKATLSEGISLTVQFASASVMALNSIKNMWDIYNNPDLSGGEKALQMITSMTSALMFTLPAFTAVVKKVQEFGRASILASVAQQKVTAGFTQEAAAAAGAAAAQQASGAAAMKAGLMAQTAWGPLLPVILAITAVVVGLAAAISFAASEAKNKSPEEQLKKAQAAAEQLAEAEQDARQKADDLRSAIEKYDSAVDTLNQCTKGTKEWEEALVEVNSQVSDILKKFPELLKEQDLFNKDGSLNRDVLDQAQQRADSLATSASAASLIGQANVENKRAVVATSDMADKYETHVSGNGVTYDYNRGHTDGTYSSVNADLEKVLQSYDNVGSKALELGDIYTILGNVTEDYAEDVLKLAQSHVDAAQMMENANKLIINEWADTNGEELATGQAELMAQKQQEYYDSFAEAFKQASDQNMKAHNVDHSTLGDAFKGTSFEGMSVTEAFNAARGTSYSLAGNGVRGTDSNRSYVYLENGEEKEYKLEEMQAAVAAAAALEKMGESAENAASMLSTLKEKAGEDVGLGLQNYLSTSNLESMNKKDFDALSQGISDAGDAETYLQQVFGKSNEELIALLGEDYGNDLQTAVDNYALAFNDFKSGLYDIVQKGYEGLDDDKDNLSVEGQKAIAQAMQNAFINGGKEGLEDVSKVFDSLDETNIQEFANLVDNTDWSITGPEEFIQAMEDAGIATDLTADDLTRFANVMSKQDLSQKFEDLTSSYSELHKIIDGLSDGDTISSEDFDKLTPEMQEYFTMMEDGTYSLVKGAEELQSLLKGTEQRERLGDISNLKDKIGVTGERSSEGQALVDKYGTASAYNADNNTYNADTVRGQLELLTLYQEQLGIADETLQAWYADLDDGSGHFESGAAGLAEITRYAEQAAVAIENDNTSLENNKQLMQSMQESYLATATSVYELDALYTELQQTMGEMGASANAYNEALISMGSQYDNTSEEITALQEAMANVKFDSNGEITKESQEILDAAQKALKAATLIGEAAEKYGLEAKVLETQAKALAKAYDLDEEAAARLAIANQRMNKGISTLNKEFKGWKQTLQSCEKTSQDYAEAVVGITEAIADLVGAEDGFELPDGFLDAPENLALIEQASNGSESAINQLGNIMAQAQVSAWQFNEALVNSAIAAGDLSDGFNADKFNEYQGIVMQGLENLKSKMGELADGQEVGDILGENWVEALNQMAIATGMSVDEMNGLLNKMGVQAEVTTTSVPQTMEVPTYTEVSEPNPVTVYEDDGNGGTVARTRHGWKHYTVPGPPETVDGYVQVAQIKSEGNDSVGSTPKLTWTGTSGRSAAGHSPKASTGGGSNKGGGGGSKGKKFEKKEKEKVDPHKYHKRYERMDNALEEFNDILSHTKSAMDDAWGEQRIKQMQKYQNQLQVVAKTQKTMIAEVKKYHDIDKAALMATPLGKIADFAGGQYSDLANPETLRMWLQTQYETALANKQAVYDLFTEGQELTEADEQKLADADKAFEEATKQLDEYQEKLDQFLETHDKLREEIEEQIQHFRDYITSRVDEITYQLELKLKIPEKDLLRLERFIDRIGEIGVITGDTMKALNQSQTKIGEKIKGYLEEGYDLISLLGEMNPKSEKFKNEFRDKFGDDALNKWLEDTSAIPAEIMDNYEEAIASLWDLVEDLYDNFQDKWDTIIADVNNYFKQFDRITDKLESQISRLDMLDSLLDINPIRDTQAGRDSQRKINETRAANAWTSARNADALYNSRKLEYEKLDKVYKEQEARLSGAVDDEERKAIQFTMKNIAAERENAYAEMTAAEQDRNSKISEAAQIMKENLEKEFDMLTAEFEEGLNGMFSTLDDAIEMFDQKAELRDWYLDPVETKYEFDSLLAKIDDAMEDTTDVETLQKLADYREKILEWQQSGKDITQEQFDIENKRFELLKMEADFEDSRASKNTMRLHRDASGNYTYVYSDDETKQEDKTQQMRDLQNEIYKAEKAALRAADSMYFQTYKQLTEYIRLRDEALRQGDEQYAAMMQQKIDMTKEKLANIVQDSEMFGAMMVEDFGQVAFGYNGSITAMLGGFEDLRSMHEVYLEKAEEYNQNLIAAAREMQEECEQELRELGINYGDLERTIDEETTQMMRENDELRENIADLAAGAESYFSQFESTVRSWANEVISEIMRVIEAIYQLQAAMQQQVQVNQSAMDFDPNTDYAALYLQGKKENKTDAELADILAKRQAKMDAGYGPAGAASNDALRDIGKIWNSNPELAQSALSAIQKQNWTDKDVDVKGLQNQLSGLNQNLSNLNNALTDARGRKITQVYDGNDPDLNKRTASGGLIKTPQVRSLAEEGPELVLNAEDTEKILQAVKLVRTQFQLQMMEKAFTDTYRTQYQTDALQANLDEYHRKMQEFELRSMQTAYEENRGQNVHIDAHFPNVTAAQEIENALNDLIVQASQYQFGKK